MFPFGLTSESLIHKNIMSEVIAFFLHENPVFPTPPIEETVPFLSCVVGTSVKDIEPHICWLTPSHLLILLLFQFVNTMLFCLL